jgi:hypothetical protein
MADKHTLRRTILDAVRDCEPCAARFNDLVQHPAIEMNAAVTTDRLAQECGGLVDAGYLVDLQPGRAPLYRVTLKGLLQVKRETDLDEYIWGEYASRFAKG